MGGTLSILKHLVLTLVPRSSNWFLELKRQVLTLRKAALMGAAPIPEWGGRGLLPAASYTVSRAEVGPACPPLGAMPCDTVSTCTLQMACQMHGGYNHTRS